ncbi:MAG: ORF6N domain-containing protein [Bacteroidota bacterium]|nr:ORF6N domain-containing protein [Bacteroidota bacterium]
MRRNIKRFPEDFMFQLTWEEQRSSSEISPIFLYRILCQTKKIINYGLSGNLPI